MADEPTEPRPNSRKIREGIAIGIKMDKTVVVAVVDRVRHRRYQKTVQRTKHLYAHDPTTTYAKVTASASPRRARCRS